MSETPDQPGAGAGLLESVTVEDPAASAEANPQATEIPHQAADTTEPGKIPGAPIERPEWLPENFWDGEKGEAKYESMAKSWADLRKTISQGKHKAPADGNYDTKAWGEDAESNPMAQTLVGWAKEQGLSQAQFDDLVGKLQSQAREVMGPETIDAAAELKRLGPNGNAIVDGMVNWARGLVNKGVWGKDDFEEFRIMGGTANGLKALMKVREAYEGRVPIESVPIEGAPSKEELYQMVADPKYQTDAAYRQRVEKMFTRFAN
jgi:hypothetical protein